MASGFASVNRLEWGNSLHPSSYYSQCLHNSGGVVLHLFRIFCFSIFKFDYMFSDGFGILGFALAVLHRDSTSTTSSLQKNMKIPQFQNRRHQSLRRFDRKLHPPCP